MAVVTAASLARGESRSVGQSDTFDRPGRAIVTAQSDARVAVLAPAEGPPPARIATARRTLYARPLWWLLPALLWPTSWRRPAPLAGWCAVPQLRGIETGRNGDALLRAD